MTRILAKILIPATVLLLIPCAGTGDPKRSFPPADELPEIKELPNLFAFFDGSPVRTRSDWDRRREEIKAILLHYQFGHAPALPAPEAIEAELLSEAEALGGRAVKRELRLRFGPESSVTLSIGMHSNRAAARSTPARRSTRATRCRNANASGSRKCLVGPAAS